MKNQSFGCFSAYPGVLKVLLAFSGVPWHPYVHAKRPIVPPYQKRILAALLAGLMCKAVAKESMPIKLF